MIKQFILALTCATVAWGAQSQSWPAKPIRWVVPSTPGDGSDLTGRVIAEKISRELGHDREQVTAIYLAR